VYVTAEKTSQHSGTDATSSGVQSPDRVPRAHSVAGRQPSYAQPTVASLLRGSRSNDLLDGAVAVPICPRCRPRETEQLIAFNNTHTHTRLTALCPGLPGWAGTRKAKPISILLKQETVSGSGISWVICKSAPRCRQITIPAPHHSVFYRPDALPAAQPTVSRHFH